MKDWLTTLIPKPNIAGGNITVTDMSAAEIQHLFSGVHTSINRKVKASPKAKKEIA